MATYELDFVAIGCNRVAGCTDWGQNGLVAYSGGNFVVVYKATEARVLATLPGHTGRVNAVKWIPPVEIPHPQRLVSEETELISAGSDGHVRAWRKEGKEWISTDVLEGHTESATGLAVLMTSEGVLWVASCSSDNTVKVWKRTVTEAGKTWALHQTLDCFKSWVVESVAISTLPGSETPLVAAGSVDTKIHLFVLEEDKFIRVAQVHGHEDWVRSLSFASDNDRLLMASAGQDHRVRLWEIKKTAKIEHEDNSAILKKVSETATTERDITKMFERHQQNHVFEVSSGSYSVMLESVLIGHEDWVTQVIWKPPTVIEGKLFQELTLLTISIDRTMMIWQPDVGPDGSGLWLDQSRVGEVGGNQLGFFGGSFGLQGSYIFSHGANGGFHLWKQSNDLTQWDPIVTVSGHFNDVCDVDWDPHMNYFISTSYDQTTRLWSQWDASHYFPQSERKNIWLEIARPQVHGYDLSCLTFVRGTNHRFTSGAEEKILRVFDAPQSFVSSLENLSHVKTEEDTVRPVAANVPPLGLSNKPLYEGQSKEVTTARVNLLDIETGEMTSLYSKFDLDQTHHGHVPLVLEIAPYEEQLMQRTLWAEMHKLYGHPNEMKSVTCNYKGSLLASGCKAAVKPLEAAIRIWDTKNWTSKSTIQFHKSTVTQLEFSHSDEYLLSVSKARTIAVMRIEQGEEEVTVKMIGNCVGHNRMINCCSWSHDDKYFITGSRDNKSPNAKVWVIEAGKLKSVTSMLFKSPISSVAFCPIMIDQGYLVAFGLEDGGIALWRGVETTEGKLEWKEYLKVLPLHSHTGHVKRLKWRSKGEGEPLFLLSCSKDFSIRLFKINK